MFGKAFRRAPRFAVHGNGAVFIAGVEGAGLDVSHAGGDGDYSQLFAVPKGALDGLHAAREGHFRQAGIGERVLADFDQALWKIDAGKVDALVKGAVADMGHAIGDHDGSNIGT